MSQYVIVYHHNCADGFGALWAVAQKIKDYTAVPGIYNGEPVELSQFTNKDVIIVDFSFPPETLLDICSLARSVTWIDHHKSAIDAWDNYCLDNPYRSAPNLINYLDNERSGAMLAWNYYFRNTEPPLILQYIQDRDLWQFKLPFTREVNAYIFSLDYNMDVWDKLMSVKASSNEFGAIVSSGAAIIRKQDKDVAEMVNAAKDHVKLGGHAYPVVCVPYMWASDACALVLRQNPEVTVAASYYVNEGKAFFSLRSRNDDTPRTDVSTIAKAYGGGGHECAAGFNVPLSQLPNMIL